MNTPTSSQEMRFLLTDAETVRKGARIAAKARRRAQPTPLVRAARQALAWLKEWPARRAAMRELRSLTDRELADIGLARQDIRNVFSRH